MCEKYGANAVKKQVLQNDLLNSLSGHNFDSSETVKRHLRCFLLYTGIRQ